MLTEFHGDFAILPRELILAENVTLGDVKVYLAILSHHRPERPCWPSVARLMEMTGLTRSTVFLALDRLEGLLLVSREGRAGMTTLYRVTRPMNRTPPVRSAGPHPSDPPDPEAEIKKQSQEEDPPTPQRGARETWAGRIGEVFDHWRKVMDHPQAKLIAKRERVIKARLKEGYSVDDLKSAIDGCSRSSWHMGNNPSSKRYDDLSLILRDGEKVEGFASGGGRPQKGWLVRMIEAEDAERRQA